MLKVPCTEAIVIPRSAASRRMRPASSGGMRSGMSGMPGAVEAQLHAIQSAGLDRIQAVLQRPAPERAQ